jgi:hypothetical protein
VSVGRGVFLCRVRRRAFLHEHGPDRGASTCAAYVGSVTRQALMG